LVASWLTFKLALAEESVLRRTIGSSQRAKIVLATCTLLGVAFFALLELGPTQARLLAGIPRFVNRYIPESIATDIGLQLATVMGLGVLLLPFGLLNLARLADSRRKYILASLSLVFLPISLDPVYGILLATPLVLLISATALVPRKLGGMRSRRSQVWKPVTIVIMVAIAVIAIPAIVTIPRSSGLSCGQSWVPDDETYNAAIFTKYLQRPQTTFAWDDPTEANRIEAISGVPAVEPLQSLGTLEYPWLKMKIRLEFVGVSDLSQATVGNHQLIEAKEWLSSAGLGYNYYWGKHTLVLLQNPPNSVISNQILEFYQAEYAIQRCLDGRSAFFVGLDSSNYVVYSDQLQRIFLL
jgi:hypothetical protein